MNVLRGDLWDYHGKPGNFIVIPVNLGLVMGRGLAAQYKRKFGDLPKNAVCWTAAAFNHLNGCLFFPVKKHWSNKTDLELIHSSCQRLLGSLWNISCRDVYLPLVGCGFGEGRPEQIVPILKFYFGYLPNVHLVLPNEAVRRRHAGSLRLGARKDAGLTGEQVRWIEEQFAQ